MYNKKLYSFFLAVLTAGFQTFNAQSTILFSQNQQLEGNAISGSSSIARSIHIADDFSFASDVNLNHIYLTGAQLMQTLPNILLSTNIYIVERENLTQAPGTENVVYQSVGNLDGVTLISNGMDQDFKIDLSSKNINLQANKKYWLIFTANINAPYPSNMTDWHNFPGQNTPGTSVAKSYTNGAWSNLSSGLTFDIAGKNNLGTSETFSSKANVFASSVVSQYLEVRMDDFKSLSVFDFTGRMILTSEKNITDVGALTAGTYLGMVTNKNGKSITSKFIKK